MRSRVRRMSIGIGSCDMERARGPFGPVAQGRRRNQQVIAAKASISMMRESVRVYM
jgi:hypothetical protein